MSSLKSLLAKNASQQDIAAFLESLAPHERVRQTVSVTGKGVSKLYEAVAGAAPLEPTDFVPDDAPPTTTVIFQGRNSLPLLSRFQKRFARLPTGQIVGYNHQTFSLVTGPGYFVIKPPDTAEVVPDELYFDYTVAPGGVPDGWPAYKPNAAGLSKPVFGGLKDYIRRVAPGIVVGKAFRDGKPEGAFFTLSRQE